MQCPLGTVHTRNALWSIISLRRYVRVWIFLEPLIPSHPTASYHYQLPPSGAFRYLGDRVKRQSRFSPPGERGRHSVISSDFGHQVHILMRLLAAMQLTRDGARFFSSRRRRCGGSNSSSTTIIIAVEYIHILRLGIRMHFCLQQHWGSVTNKDQGGGGEADKGSESSVVGMFVVVVVVPVVV